MWLTKIVKRISKSVTIDPRVWKIVEIKAKSDGIAASRWLENYLFSQFQLAGWIEQTQERLGEIRGGDRTKND